MLLNVGVDGSALADVRVRRALAMATDNVVLAEDRVRRRRAARQRAVQPGPGRLPRGHRLPGVRPRGRHRPRRGVRGRERAAEHHLRAPPTTRTTVRPTSSSPAIWQAVGIEVTINQSSRAQYILKALQGNFQVFGWRNHGGVDPDSQRIWWHSETGDQATNPLALNFGGIDDADIDAQLERHPDHRTTTPSARPPPRRSTGSSASRCTTSGTPGPCGASPTSPRSTASSDFTFPDGTGTISGAGIAGTHQLVQMWVEQ